jgi:hypothetical protein
MAAPSPLGATRLIGAAFRLFFANFTVFFPLAFAMGLLQEALLVPLRPSEPGTVGSVLALSFLSVPLGLLALALMVSVARDHDTLSLRQHVDRVLRRLLPLIVLGLAISIASGLGLMLLVVPGLYVMARYQVWLPCLLFEDLGYGALGRAEALTQGHRWPLVGALLILALLSLGITLLVAPLVVSGFAGPDTLFAALIGSLMVAIELPVFACYLALLHRRLRDIEDAGAT